MQKGLIHLIRTLMYSYRKGIVLVLSCIMIVCMCGCGVSETVKIQVSQGKSNVNMDSVSLSNVNHPIYKQKFCSVYAGGTVISVFWGAAEEDNPLSSFFWQKSSFPGFDFPVVIETHEKDWGENVTIKTEYGKYTYRFSEKCGCIEENWEIHDTGTGKKIVSWSMPLEKLYVFYRNEEYVSVYDFVEGTIIKEI